MFGQDLTRRYTRFFRGLCFGPLCSEIAEHCNATIADDFFGNFVKSREYSPDAIGSSFVGYGTTCDGEMRLFNWIAAKYLELGAVIPSGRAALECPVNQRTHDVPTLRSAITGWPAKAFMEMAAF